MSEEGLGCTCTQRDGARDVIRVAIFSNVNRILYASAHFPINETVYIKREGAEGLQERRVQIIHSVTKLFRWSFIYRITRHST